MKRHRVSMTTPLKLSLLHVDAATLDRRHQQYSPMVSWVSRNVTSKEVTMVSWVSRNDASKEVTPPVTLSSLIQELDRAFAKRTTYNGEVDLEDNTPSGKMTPKGATAIAVSETDGTDFHLEQPNRSHCTRQTTPPYHPISPCWDEAIQTSHTCRCPAARSRGHCCHTSQGCLAAQMSQPLEPTGRAHR